MSEFPCHWNGKSEYNIAWILRLELRRILVNYRILEKREEMASITLNPSDKRSSSDDGTSHLSHCLALNQVIPRFERDKMLSVKVGTASLF